MNARMTDKSKHNRSQDDTEKKRGALQRVVAVLKKARLDSVPRVISLKILGTPSISASC